MLAVLLSISTARAVELAYSFEQGLEGFSGNGGGVTVAQDTIGATEGENSLRFAVIQQATFVGALTGQFDPAIIGDPPGVDFFLIDLTITEQFTGTFANMGVTAFGDSQPDYPGGQQSGLQVQFIDNEMALGNLEPGTYRDFRLDLSDGNFHPLTFEFPVSFNEAFGELGSGQDDLILTGFQFYINKSADAPITVYIDNVRTGMVVEGDYNGDGLVNLADYTAWRDNLGLEGDATVAQGDGTGDGNVTLDDYSYWKERFGGPAASVAFSSHTVPEPSSGLLVLVATYGWLTRRKR
jgi:hypothetical protein